MPRTRNSKKTGDVTRFAPSPTGHLHLGHAFAALTAYHAARKNKGSFLLRIEDIDPGRCKKEFAESIEEDLAWLGLDWEKPVLKQSKNMKAYTAAASVLDRKGLLFPCFCTRSDIQSEIDKSGQAPHGPDGPVYPGTCQKISVENREVRMRKRGASYALRLDMKMAAAAGGLLTWKDRGQGGIKAQPAKFGDVVLARKDTPTSYHLASVVDDHQQGVTLVTRGADLMESTHVHRLLQALLGYDPPEYFHHRLIRDPVGRRLAKRDKDLTIRSLREANYTPDEVRTMTGFEG